MVTSEIVSLLLGVYISGMLLKGHIILAIMLSPSILGLWELAHIPISNKDSPKNVASIVLIAVIELLFSWVVGWLYIPVVLVKLIAPVVKNSESN